MLASSYAVCYFLFCLIFFLVLFFLVQTLASSYAGCEADPGLCMATENGGVSSTFTGVANVLLMSC